MSAVDVTIIDFAAHTAYLEPLTGTGFLLLPLPEHDIAALAQPFVEVAWSHQTQEFCWLPGLSLHRADWEYVLRELDRLGWFLLDDEQGGVEIAGHSVDPRLAMCLYGDDSVIDEPSLEEIRAALTALHLAAGIPPG